MQFEGSAILGKLKYILAIIIRPKLRSSGAMPDRVTAALDQSVSFIGRVRSLAKQSNQSNYGKIAGRLKLFLHSGNTLQWNPTPITTSLYGALCDWKRRPTDDLATQSLQSLAIVLSISVKAHTFSRGSSATHIHTSIYVNVNKFRFIEFLTSSNKTADLQCTVVQQWPWSQPTVFQSMVLISHSLFRAWKVQMCRRSTFFLSFPIHIWQEKQCLYTM